VLTDPVSTAREALLDAIDAYAAAVSEQRGSRARPAMRDALDDFEHAVREQAAAP
jgi:hypothetical protein